MKSIARQDIRLVARARALTGVLFAAALLTGCVGSAPPAAENSDWLQQRSLLEAMDSWELRGRVNVRYDNQSDTPRINWLQQESEFQITLWGTFNAGYTTINGRPGQVTLERGDETLRASSPEQLILQQLGYELPVSQLNYWIKGLPAPDSEAQLSFNELNQLTRIRQQDWTVSLSDMRQYGAVSLPRRVELTRPRNELRLRFIGLDWTTEAAGDQ